MINSQAGSEILIISGGRGVGKTTLCQRLAAAARDAGWQVAGLVSPANLEEGIKTAIQVEDLRTGERCLLARWSRDELAEIRTPGWVFDPEVIRWGNEAIRSADPCDLLVVDELGPLELVRRQGWMAAFDALDRGEYRLVLVVVRPELLEIAQRRWTQAEVVMVHSVDEVEKLVEKLMRRISHWS